MIVDVFAEPIPVSHLWAVLAVWVAGYIGGRMLASLA